MIQDHSLDCGSNRASVSWAAQEDATGVAVHATSTQGHSTSCSSTGNSSCVLRDLRCGHTYSLQAVAGGAQCPSGPSPPLEMVTGVLERLLQDGLVVDVHVTCLFMHLDLFSFYVKHLDLLLEETALS